MKHTNENFFLDKSFATVLSISVSYKKSLQSTNNKPRAEVKAVLNPETQVIRYRARNRLRRAERAIIPDNDNDFDNDNGFDSDNDHEEDDMQD